MNCESSLYHKNTEELINGMMSFLDDPTESVTQEDFDQSKDEISSGIKTIIGMFPEPPQLKNLNSKTGQDEIKKIFLTDYGTRNNHIEKACRHKDPYMQEVNRLMFCSTMGHPPNGSPEYFRAAENYALYGKEFLDFPTDIKFPQPLDVSCFEDAASPHHPNSYPSKSKPFQGFGSPTTSKCPTNLGSSSMPQVPVMMNPTNYCSSYPFYQTPNLVQPLIYSNPFLMTQYLNMFVRETQINTSIVQQQQFHSGGIHERLVYAQMLQQQIQTNQAALVSSCFSGSAGAGTGGGGVKPKFKQDLLGAKTDSIQTCFDFVKTNLTGSVMCENLDADD